MKIEADLNNGVIEVSDFSAHTVIVDESEVLGEIKDFGAYDCIGAEVEDEAVIASIDDIYGIHKRVHA